MNDFHPRLHATQEMFEYFTTEVLGAHKSFTMAELTSDPYDFAVDACLRRQSDAIRATLSLTPLGLGHLCVAFVRPACEEFLWLAYLKKLDPGDSRQILLAMCAHEMVRSVTAQHGYMGEDLFVKLGFPAGYAAHVQHTVDMKSLANLAVRLGWPTRNGRVPDTKWIADQTGNLELYDFMFSASSRMIHFSAQEIYRRAWTEDVPSTGDGAVSVDPDDYIAYRSDFALHWLPYFLISTSALLREVAEGDVENGKSTTEAKPSPVLAEWMSFGQTPIITPRELNVSRDQLGKLYERLTQRPVPQDGADTPSAD